ncbi:MAG TPA: flagellin [Methylobacterium sp.]|uniref:flagellin N-terminal helical domain-containing protein n=1 Tax=Methylorubrum sp. B1-46 TaxID=2897334 RepID=UPI001E3C4CA0|nr:flagellin [Methylorubrum sp. B1-46]UGB26694.1 flagellin [Methylorubrum sp. B1-46]HEV2541912.1 flagellin [Methylobacterium sp.]
MTSLLTNISAMTALTTLKGINQQLDATSNRVSTGQRVSAASDNAAYWSIATTVRTDNASLSAVKDSLGLGSSAVDTAYNGLNSILSDMQNLRAKLQTALQPGVDRAKVQTEIKAIQDKMQATADSSTSSGQNWLSVNSAPSNTSYQATQNVVAGFSRDTSGTVTFSMIGVDVNAIKLYDDNAASITTPATSAQVFGSTSLTGTTVFSGGTANFSGTNEVSFNLLLDGGFTADILINKTTMASAAANLTKVTTQEFLDAINNQIAADTATTPLAGKVSASLDTAGRLTFKTTAANATASVTIQNNTVSTGNTLVDVGFGTGTAGTDARVGKGSAAGTTAGKGILDTVEGTGFSIATINIANLVGTTGDSTLSAVITQVEKAIAKVTDAGTKLGANKTQIDGQKAFVDTLMKANDRTIGILVDADIEEESTKLKALQTQQQLAVQALSIANSGSQTVLSLFR